MSGSPITDCIMTLADLLELLKSATPLAVRPTVKQLIGTYQKPIVQSPNGRVMAYPNGYAIYATQDGDTVVWVDGCRRYVYRSESDSKISEDQIIAESKMLAMPWYLAVALVGEDRVAKNILNRPGDRAGTRSETRYGGDEKTEEAAAKWRGGTRYESPENYIMRKEQIRSMLSRLTHAQRDAVVLRDYYGYSEAEIARMRTADRMRRGDHRPYSRACVSNQLCQAMDRLGYKKIPF